MRPTILASSKMNVLVLLEFLLFFQEGMCVCVFVLDKVKGLALGKLAEYFSVSTKDKDSHDSSLHVGPTQHDYVF